MSKKLKKSKGIKVDCLFGVKNAEDVVIQKNPIIGKDPKESTFMLTDGCMWEQNKQQGSFHPHAIEVVDIETGQIRYIQSGAKIKFVEGSITNGRNQADYNKIK